MRVGAAREWCGGPRWWRPVPRSGVEPGLRPSGLSISVRSHRVRMRTRGTDRKRRFGPLVLGIGHHRPPRARALSSLRLFVSAFFRDRSSRSSSVRLVTTGASTTGACTRSLGCHPGTAFVWNPSGSPHPRPYAPTQCAERTGGRGSRPQQSTLQSQMRQDRASPVRRCHGAPVPSRKVGRVIVTALTPAGRLHESVQVGVPPTTSPGRRGGGLTLAATCVGAPLYFPTPRNPRWRLPSA